MKHVAVSSLLVGCLISVAAATQVSVAPEDMALRAFLLSTYPDLAGRPLQIESSGKISVRDVGVREVLPSGLVEPRFKPLLKAHVEFTSRHELRTFEGAGPILSDQDNADLARAVQRAQSVGDLDNEIGRRGLAFGPHSKDAILARIAETDFDSTIGVSQVLAVASSAKRNDPNYGFLWTVDVQAVRAADTPRHYVIEFEPFTGRLVSLRER